MKNNTVLLYVCILFFFSVSCSTQNEISPLNTNNNSLSIKEAREFYEKKGKGTRSETSKKQFLFWDNAVESKISGNESFVSVPLINLDFFAIQLEESDSKKTKEPIYTMDIRSNLIIRKNKGVLEEFILYLVKDEESYIRKKTSLITKDNFDGYGLLVNEFGKQVSMSIFKNGKETLSSEYKSKNVRPNDMTITQCVTYYSQSCTAGYGCGPEQVVDTICETISMPGPEGNTSFTSFATAAATSGGGGGSSASDFDAYNDLPGITAWLAGLSTSERAWYLARPTIIPKAILSRNDAEGLTDMIYCNQLDHGNGNAFKHAIWSAMNAMLNSASQALEMGDLHESNSPYPQNAPERIMDETNNSLGINTFNQYRTSLNAYPPSQRKFILAGIILAKIDNGEGVRVSPTQTLIQTTSGDKCP